MSLQRTIVFVLILLAATTASAAPWVITSGDAGTGVLSTYPNALAARNSFIAVVGSGNLVTFESLSPQPAGTNFTATNFDINLGGGVIFNVNYSNADMTQSGGRLDDYPEFGFNTTASGTRHIRLAQVPLSTAAAAQVAFSFGSTTTNFFGAYITGSQSTLPGVIEITFDNGTTQLFEFTKLPGNTGGIQFWGVLADTGSFSSIRFTLSGAQDGARDIIGFDDVIFGQASTATHSPEPGTVLAVAAGMGLIALARRKFQKAR